MRSDFSMNFAQHATLQLPLFGSLSGIGTAKQKGPGLHLTYFQLYFDSLSITEFPFVFGRGGYIVDRL